MKRIVLFAFLLPLLFCVVSNVKAQQIPGYMGKRVAIGYRFHLMPGYGNSPSATQSYELDEYGEPIAQQFKINTYHRGFVEFVVARNKSLIFQGLFSKAQFNPWWQESYSQYRYTSKGWGQMTSYGGSLGIRWYKKHLAPLSSFFGVNAGWQITSVEDLVVYDREQIETNIPGDNIGNLIMGFELGTNRVIQDKFILTFTFESNLAVGLLFRQYLDIERSPNPFVKDAALRGQLEQLVSVGIGFGFLP